MAQRGEALRHAVQWISNRRQENPDLKLWQLIDEASLQFDLSPPDAEFLLRNWKELAEESGEPAAH
ncbi:hypothetical protein [Vulgatibacter sp.]|uniref:hypothetical protein n=1 Tax=Vulgatibacter sp. TaxID=1971226 RepID=UPI0035617F45